MNARHELKREAETIMLAGGFAEARAEHFGPWWRVYGKLAGDNEHVGTTHLQADPQDPREMARTLVLRAKAEQIKDEPAAPETVEDTFPQGEGPFDAQPEASETPSAPDDLSPSEPGTPSIDDQAEESSAHETHGEAGEETAADDAGDRGVSDSAGSTGSSGHGTGERLPGDADDFPGDDAEPVDADFSEYAGELPQIELIPPDPDPDFGAELLEFEGELSDAKEEAPSGAFIFGDNLDQKRTAAIGLVVQIALQKMPAITPADDARLAELRNFTLGVSEGRWANDPGKQAELEGLELIASLARQVEATRDAKVAFLVAANREQIEAFDPESDWP